MHKRAVLALLGAGIGLGLLLLIWFLAFHVGFSARADARILNGFAGLQRPRLDSIARRVAHLCDPRPYVLLAALPVVVALLRRRVRTAVVIGGILLGANMTTQLLKPLLAAPRPVPLPSSLTVSLASWPSGHATAAMSLALCCVIAAAPRWRPLAATLGALFAIAVSFSFLILTWHYPSDVFGGYLVAAVWTMLGTAAVVVSGRAPARPAASAPGRRLSIGQALEPAALAVLAALAVAGLVTLARPHAVVAYARGHKTFLAGALAIAAAGLVLATAIMVLVAGLELRLGAGGRRRHGLSDSGPAATGAPRPRWRRG